MKQPFKLNPVNQGAKVDGGGHGRKGILTALIRCDHPENVIVQAPRWAIATASGIIRMCSDVAAGVALASMLILNPVHASDKSDTRDIVWIEKVNSYVNTGLNNALDREWGLGGTAIGYIGVSSNTTAVTASTVFLNGGSGGAAANTIIKAISPAATRTGQTTTGGATFTNADFTSGVFVWSKIGLLTTSTDAGTGLVDVIGGTGGSSPYNRTFTLDLTSAGTFSVTAQIAVTATAT